MPGSQLLWFSLAFCVGAMLPVQAGMNAQLRSVLGSPFRASLVNFLVGAAALACAALLAGGSLARDRPGAWWVWFGGLLGAVQVLATVVLAPRLGAAALVAAVVAGQFAVALALDHWGLFGYARYPLSWTRASGIVLMSCGALLALSR